MARNVKGSALTADAPAVAQWLEQVASGARIKDAGKASGVPWTTVSRLLAHDTAFQARYVQARKAAAALRAEEAGDVLRQAARDPLVKAEANAIVSIAKARSEYLRWLARVQDAGSYGEKQTIEQDTTVRVLVEYASPPAADLAASPHPARIAAPPTEPAQLAEYTIEVDDA